MTEPLHCWKCGAELVDQPLPIGRRDTCRSCEAELHVCKMCQDYDTSRANECREPMAEDQSSRELANFCGYFAPSADAYRTQDTSAVDAARAALEDLFK